MRKCGVFSVGQLDIAFKDAFQDVFRAFAFAFSVKCESPVSLMQSQPKPNDAGPKEHVAQTFLRRLQRIRERSMDLCLPFPQLYTLLSYTATASETFRTVRHHQASLGMT
jgi:hypothetical protein